MGPPAGLSPLPRSFYDRGVLLVARDLLGCYAVGGGVVVRLTEVEAYGGVDDPASHAFRAATPRNSVMFGPPGHLYVYFTYGMHHCANVVTGSQGAPGAVLLRAGEVVAGEAIVRARRPTGLDVDRARGPARLAKAFGLDLSHNGADVTQRDAPLWLAGGDKVPEDLVNVGPRVGIRAASDYPWRFSIAGDASVSQFRLGTLRKGRIADGGQRATRAAGQTDTPDNRDPR
ncbi:MAG: DNA-3-methyladenine glycosylase [Frankiaceae bacterium]|nr:DNA-3-methyladenine glycosylase [Frankiaceae bacterium]